MDLNTSIRLRLTFVLAGLGPAIHAFKRPKQRRGCADQVRARRFGGWFLRARSLTEPLRGHLAHEVALADLDAETAQDVVSRRRVEIEIRHREVIEVGLGTEIARLPAGGNRDLLV